MDGQPFVITAFINDISFANTLIDTGCLSYGLCGSDFAQKNNFARLQIKPREVMGFDGKIASCVDKVAVVDIDLDGHRQSKVFLYIAPIGHYDMILGMPWIISQDVRINGPQSEMLIRSTGTRIRSNKAMLVVHDVTKRPTQISAVAFKYFTKSYPKEKGVQVFAASMSDINKALTVKQRSDPALKLPTQYHEFLDVFDHKMADLLPPLR
ncbi:hypothetical protein K3495_g16931, partial [Podosphaera aphanis]